MPDPRDPSLPRRQAVRVVIIDDDARVLLLPTHDPRRLVRAPWWELPGGGLRPGEDNVAGARRELAEELGWAGSEPLVDLAWSREVVYPRDEGWIRQSEQVLLLRLPPAPSSTRWTSTAREPSEVLAHGHAQWKTAEQVVESGERFFPDSLPRWLPSILAGSAPLDVAESVTVFW